MKKNKNIKLLEKMWDAGLNQRTMAEAVGLSRITIDRLVNCRTIPARSTAELIEKYFNCEKGELFEIVHSKKPNYQRSKTCQE